MADAELQGMVMNFRVSDLQVLLGFAGKNKTGKKQELQTRAIELVKMNYPHVNTKIKELHNRRYHNQLLQARPANYEIPDRTLTDRSISSYESAMNNNYSARCNPNVRPMSMNHVQPPTYSGKPYLTPVPSQSHFSPYADVRFRDLPFFDIVHILLRPFSLIPDPVDRLHENTYTFGLSPQEAHDIAVSRDVTGNYECQILLRFCILDSSTEQDDNFPPNVTVKVNNKPVQLPNPIPTNRPGVEPKRPSKPVNITQATKLSPTVNNNLSISWSSSYGRSYAAVLYIAKSVSSFTLLQRLKNRAVRDSNFTKSIIIEKLGEDQDSEIATTSLQASLLCPLGKSKLKLPCRANTCNHIACFDASLYIQLNEKKPKWRCPVCDKPAYFKHLILDGLFMDILAMVPKECVDVQLHEDGSWTPIMPVKKPKDEPKLVVEPSKKNTSKSVEVVDISSDSDTEDMWKDSKNSNGSFDDESPPLMYIPQEGNTTLTPPLSIFPPPPPVSSVSVDYASRSNIPMPVPVCLTSNVQTDMQSSEDLNILPDIMSQSDNSMPSTSNSGLGSSYPPYSVSDCSAFCSNNSDAFQEQTTSENNQNLDPYKNYLDFISMLSIPESEQQKYESMAKELAEKESNLVPDVISLDE